MSFPRYPNYKDSGVEWLGAVPAHWKIIPLGRETLAKCDGPFGSGLKSEHYPDVGVRVIRLQNIRRDGCDGSDEAFIDETYFMTELNGHDVRRRDILIAGLGDEKNTVGRACVAPSGIEPALVKADCFRFRLDLSQALPEFIAIQLTSGSVADAGVLSSGSTRSRIALSMMASRKLGLPPLPEQTRIAEFLDRETAKIDELVAEQRRLMALLKEKRQAVISHAVTQGLNPSAKLKPSGIEWLGDVPVHWRVGKCGFYLTILSGYAFPSSGFSEDESKPKLLRGINVGVSRLKWDETVYWQREPGDGLDVYEMRAGDLVIGMDRPLIAEGIRVAKVKEADLPCLLLQRVASLNAGSKLNVDYFMALLSSEMFVAHFAPDTTGVSVPHISPKQIYNFVIPVPPIEEQDGIARHIDSKTANFDALTAEAQRAIDLLQERRTALISAAVTGQIDVRALAAAPAEALLHAAEDPASYGS